MHEKINMIKERISAVPKKYKLIGVGALALVLILVLLMSGGEKKLSGTFVDSNQMEHRFKITNSGEGDYGGTVKYKSIISGDSTATWYITNEIVYINGKAKFGFTGDYLYYLQSNCRVTVGEGGYISGGSEDYSSEDYSSREYGAIWFSNRGGRTCKFVNISNVECEGTYTLKGNVVKIYDMTGEHVLTYILVNNSLHRVALTRK